MSNGWPEISADGGRVVIMIGGVGVSIRIEDSQRVRREMVAAELEAGRQIAATKRK